MTERRSIYVEGFSHKNPIPAASRIGNMVYSGVILGTDPATGQLADSLEAQARLMFGHMRRIIEAAGGSVDDIIKVTVWMADRTQRAALNGPWQELFPNPASRPARHTQNADMDAGKHCECDFVAVITPIPQISGP
jgi:2-iminobutanoate/2-iminopropanoate deaminase